MRRAGRKDAVQAGIVKALREHGMQVFIVNQEGLPDLLVYHRGRWLPIEIKKPAGALTAAQQRTRALAWFPVAQSATEALRLCYRMKRT